MDKDLDIESESNQGPTLLSSVTRSRPDIDRYQRSKNELVNYFPRNESTEGNTHTMRLQIHHVDRHQHQKTLVSACCWTPNNEIMTCADDHTIVKWKMNGECLGVVTTLPPTTFVTAMDWIPSVGSAKSELFAAACTDGGFRLFSATGREEKRVMGNGIIGHNPSSSSSSSGGGAIVTLKWNYDGSALATGSEDGHVRIWSRSGNLRSTLASTGKPVYALAWGPDNDELCYASGSDLVLKSSGGNSQSSKSKKPVAWVAHVGGVITALDWHPIHHRILSGGEDRVYRIWDVYGRQLYQSQACGHVITSLAWSPNGETFVVGAYDLLRLCDKAGWSYHQGESSSSSSSSTSTTLGCSLMALRWSRDGTQVCGAGGNGQVIFAQIVDRVVEWGSVTARLQSPHELHVLHENEHSSSNEEVLAFGREHRILDFQLGFGYLVVTTTSRQCHVYSVENWHTPHVFDVRVCPHLMLQSPSHVLLADVVTGITIYSYEGRVVSTPKFHGLAVEFLHPKTMSLSADTLSIVDRTSSSSSSGSKSKSNTSRSQNQPQPTDQPQQHHHHQCLIRHFDVTTGRPLSSTPVTHHALDILELSLNTFGPRQDRKILYLDINRDLFLQPLYTSQTSSGGHKLTSQVTSACWSDESDQLVAITDGQLMSWSYPSMVLVDKSLLALTCTHVGQGSAGASSSSSGTSLSKPETVMMNGGASMSSSSILSFVHTRVTLRRVDGALWTTAVSPYTLMLYRLMTTSDHRHHSGQSCQVFFFFFFE